VATVDDEPLQADLMSSDVLADVIVLLYVGVASLTVGVVVLGMAADRVRGFRGILIVPNPVRRKRNGC
jgi:hypothetical protein